MAGYATGSESWRFEYNGDFRNFIKNWIVHFRGGYSQLNFNRFYGFGNNNELAFDVEDDFYRISEELYYAESQLIKETKFGKLFGSVSFYFSDLDTSENNILNSLDIKGAGSNRFLKAGIGYEWDHRDNINYPREGFWLRAVAEYTPALLDNKEAYSRAQLHGHLYFTLFNKLTFAYHAYAAKLWNDFFITDAIHLGGTQFLRGYSRERFSGNAALFSALELRFPLTKLYIIIPQNFGLTLHAESGRVYNENLGESNKWLNSFGGGIWTSYLNDLIVISTTVSASKEDTQFYITTGFTF